MDRKHMTVFNRCFQKTGSCLTDLPAWIEEIRSGKYQEAVSRLRSLRNEGKSAQADEVKQTLPALAPAGNCMEGRQIPRLKDRTGVAMFDQDKMSPEQVTHAAQVLREVPWVMAGHITSSGCGYRTFVDIGRVHPDVYREAYLQVAETIGQLTGSPCDTATCDLCRLSYTSFDPDAFYREDALPYPYPAGRNPLNYVPLPSGGAAEDFSEDFYRMSGFTEEKTKPAEPVESSACKCVPKGVGDQKRLMEKVDSVLQKYLKKHPLVVGRRHLTLLRMGQYACWRNLSRREFENLKIEAFKLCPDMHEREVSQALEWGFTHGYSDLVNKGSVPKCQDTNFSCARADGPDGGEEGEDFSSPEESEEDEVKRHCPLFPEEVYENLPHMLQKGLAAARTPRERDMLLMAMLTNLSGCLPGTHMLYARHDYTPHLYFAAIAPAGSGKGVVSLAAGLGARIEQMYEADNERNSMEFTKQSYAWEMEKRQAQKEGREPNWDLQPEPFRRKIFLLPSNISKSQFMLNLEAAEEVGMVANCSEMDSFSSSLGSDCGKYAAELRMIFHHETVGQNYKIDGRPIVIKKPRLAMCMSGTLLQLVRFVNSKEDGMYSRMALLTGEGSSGWISAAPDAEGVLDGGALFEVLSEQVLELFRFSQNHPLEVRFSSRQWKEHTRCFGLAWNNVSMEEGEGNMAIVGRHGLIASRLAMVFTALRRFETGFAVDRMECSDEDFRRIMLIAQCLLEHSLSLSTILPGNGTKRKQQTTFFRIRSIFSQMADEFTFSHYIESIENAGLSRRSGTRSLAKLMENGEVEKVEHGLYRKTSAGKKGQEKIWH